MLTRPRYCGELEVHDIGLDFVDDDGECLDDVDERCDLAEMASLYLVPGALWDDKYSRGVVGIDTGSKFPGAAVLGVLGRCALAREWCGFLGQVPSWLSF